MLANSPTQYLLCGADPGNSNIKLSYLTPNGSIKDLAIPTIIAAAPSSVSELGSSKSIKPTDNIHVLLKPIDTNGFVKGGYYYVGSAAKLSPEAIEATDDVSKHESQLHIITLIVGEAIAALDNGLEGNVHIPPSAGLPVKIVKDGYRQVFLDRLKGSFEVTFLDGVYKGKSIIITHEIHPDEPVSSYIHAEATKAGLGLAFDLNDFKLIENDVSEDISDPDQPYIVSDPGGGTFDIAVFEEDGINTALTTTYTFVPEEFRNANLGELVGKEVGANYVIDQLIEDTNNAIIEFHEKEKIPLFKKTFFRNRSEFIDLILKPYIDDLVKGEKDPEIKRTFGTVEVDLTEVVVPKLDVYGNMVFYLNMLTRQNASTIKNNMIIGGGVLLGYKVLRDRQYTESKIKLYELPPKKKIFTAPFINSRSYLIESFLKEQEIVEVLKKQRATTKK